MRLRASVESRTGLKERRRGEGRNGGEKVTYITNGVGQKGLVSRELKPRRNRGNDE